MIPLRLHAVLDGLSAAGLTLGPTLLDWPRALRRPLFAAGAGVAAYSLATRYQTDSRGALSFDEHRALDAAQGLAFLAVAATLSAPRNVRLSLAGYGAFSLAAAALTRSPRAGRGPSQRGAVEVADEEQVEVLQHHQRVHRQGQRAAPVGGMAEDPGDRRQKQPRDQNHASG
ncbi:hypothetical protein [Cereibacter changlensis]|uniref:Uncharacterized protein n=1 Tax=Cereibacter changlensis TaxID=402884 RepID=A0A2W7QQC7_9RHOB|nr:hypothetical protein [Cereibacter changlensis]PZX49486.1 hypothetical protein LX76_03813 [Cereibacter changlensis]